MITKIAICAVTAAIFGLATTAPAAPSGITLSPDKTVTLYHGAPLRRTPSQWKAPAGKITIVNTLGSGNAYDTTQGWTVANPQSGDGGTQWIAFPFTPTTNMTVTEFVEGVSYVRGTDSVTIALLADNGGVPGAVLAQKTVTNLEVLGGCCSVAVDRLKTGVPVTAGTTYWVGAILPRKTQATSWDAWNYSTANTNIVPFAFYTGKVWNQTSGTYAAFAVFGH